MDVYPKLFRACELIHKRETLLPRHGRDLTALPRREKCIYAGLTLDRDWVSAGLTSLQISLKYVCDSLGRGHCSRTDRLSEIQAHLLEKRRRYGGININLDPSSSHNTSLVFSTLSIRSFFCSHLDSASRSHSFYV